MKTERSDLWAHPHTGCNPRPWFFLPPNLTVFWVNLGSMRAPVGLLQYLRRLWCNSTEDSSEKSTFCHFSSIHPFGRLWALAKATRFFNCLLFSAGFWALIRPWRPFRDRIPQTVLVDMGTSGDQVSWNSAAVEKGLAGTNGPPKRLSCGVCLTWACQKCLQSLHIFFLSSVLDAETHWRCLPPQQWIWSSASW